MTKGTNWHYALLIIGNNGQNCEELGGGGMGGRAATALNIILNFVQGHGGIGGRAATALYIILKFERVLILG